MSTSIIKPLYLTVVYTILAEIYFEKVTQWYSFNLVHFCIFALMCNVKLCRNYIETVYNQNRIVWVNKLRSSHLCICFQITNLEERFQITQMTTVQQRAIPHLMSGRDVMVKSQTGSGSSFTYMYITVETSGLCEKSAYIHFSIRGEKEKRTMNGWMKNQVGD